jgi:hypothetical protein
MDQRREFLVDWISHQMTRTALCAVYGITRETGYKWARRAKKERSIEEHPHMTGI